MSSPRGRALMLDRALALLFAKYPARTSLGIAIGGTLALLAHLFEPTLKGLAAINSAAVPWFGWFPVGILLMHLPTIQSVLKERSIGNDEVDMILALIDRADFTPAERRHQYRLLIERVRDGLQMQRAVGEKAEDRTGVRKV